MPLKLTCNLVINSYCDLLLYLGCNWICITPGTPGHYTATISGFTVSTESGNSYSELFMYLNDQRVDETWFASGYPGGGGHYYYDQGSRTMVSQTDWTKPKPKLSVSDLPHERRWHSSCWGYQSKFTKLLQAYGSLHIIDYLGLLIVWAWFE